MSLLNNAEISGDLTVSGTISGQITVSPKVKIESNKNVSPSNVEQVVVPSENYDALAQVTVEAIDLIPYEINAGYAGNTLNPPSGKGFGELTIKPLQNKTVTPTSSQQTIQVDNANDYLGLGTVTVGAVPANEETLDKMMYSHGDVLNHNVIAKSGSNTCYGFSDVKLNLTLPNNITIIKQRAFQNINFLKTIECPMVASIMDDAFKNCSNLVSARFSRTGIMDGKIYSGAFENCGRLTDVYFASFYQIYSSDYDQFTGMGNLTVHVPASLLETYQNDTEWQNLISYVYNNYMLTLTIVGDYVV